MRADKDLTWLEVAATIAKRGTCLRRQVGCVLVDVDGQVLSTGYNGVAHGLPHCNEVSPETAQSYGGKPQYPHACPGAFSPSGTNLDACGAVHAEQNALLQCKDPRLIHTCYVTHSPCVTCAKLLLNTGCSRVIFNETYAHDDAAKQLWFTKPGDRTWGQPV